MRRGRLVLFHLGDNCNSDIITAVGLLGENGNSFIGQSIAGGNGNSLIGPSIAGDIGMTINKRIKLMFLIF